MHVFTSVFSSQQYELLTRVFHSHPLILHVQIEQCIAAHLDSSDSQWQQEYSLTNGSESP